MKFRNIATIVLCLSFAATGFAEPKKKAKKKRHHAPYGMAGCGLGSLIIKRDSVGPQIGAAFLNNLFAPQTSAITTGSSNCRSYDRMAKLEQEIYLKANFASLSKEAAQGQGEHLDGFADVFGCPVHAWGSFNELSKNNYQELFRDSDLKNILNRYHSHVSSHETLSQECENV